MRDYLAPERDRTALVTIDAQRDFALPGARSRSARAPAFVTAMGRLAAAFRARSRPIFHMVRLYRCDGSNVDLYHRASIEEGQRIAMPGSAGAELVDELKLDSTTRLEHEVLLDAEEQKIGPQEWILYKPRPSAFFATTLEARLRGLGVSTVVICGSDFPSSPRASIYAAANRDCRIVLVADAVSHTTDAGLRELGGIGARLMNTDTCLGWLAADPAAREQSAEAQG